MHVGRDKMRALAYLRNMQPNSKNNLTRILKELVEAKCELGREFGCADTRENYIHFCTFLHKPHQVFTEMIRESSENESLLVPAWSVGIAANVGMV